MCLGPLVEKQEEIQVYGGLRTRDRYITIVRKGERNTKNGEKREDRISIKGVA